jgi:hypothetical protein
MLNDTEADVRTDAAIKIAAMFFIAIMFLAVTTDPIATGTQVNERAPALEGMMYNGSGWSSFNMEDYITSDWTPEDRVSPWLLVDFMDTDCPYCYRATGTVYDDSMYFMKYTNTHPAYPGIAPWDGPVVNFVGSATELAIPDHETSRDEIKAFRDKSGSEMCNQGKSACDARDGGVHRFPYIDDIDQDNMKAWKVSGTPQYYLVQPDGIVAWRSIDNNGETVADAILRLAGGQP